MESEAHIARTLPTDFVCFFTQSRVLKSFEEKALTRRHNNK